MPLGRRCSRGEFTDDPAMSFLTQGPEQFIVGVGIADVDTAAQDGIAFAAGQDGLLLRGAVDPVRHPADDGDLPDSQFAGDEFCHPESVDVGAAAPYNGSCLFPRRGDRTPDVEPEGRIRDQGETLRPVRIPEGEEAYPYVPVPLHGAACLIGGFFRVPQL